MFSDNVFSFKCIEIKLHSVVPSACFAFTEKICKWYPFLQLMKRYSTSYRIHTSHLTNLT